MSTNRIDIQIKTLTPVHIGSGNDLQANFDYLFFPEEGRLGLVDTEKVFHLIGEEHISQWVAAIDNQQDLLKALPQLAKASSADIAKRSMDILGRRPDSTKNSIKEQIHLGQQQPAIPGSSLKGAIRTAVLSKLIREKPDFVKDERNVTIEGRGKKRFNAEQVEAHYLSLGRPSANRQGQLRISPHQDAFRFLRVGDVCFDDRTCVVKNEIANQFHNGKWGPKKEESSFYECIPSNATAIGSLQVPADAIKRYQEQQRGDFTVLRIFEDTERLFRLISQHTSRLLNNEIEFWEEEGNPIAIGDYLNHLQAIAERAKQSDGKSCVLRVGAASGWEFMTGGWLSGTDVMGDYILSDRTWQQLKRQLRSKNYPDSTLFPKTRKMVEGGMPFGFVELSIK